MSDLLDITELANGELGASGPLGRTVPAPLDISHSRCFHDRRTGCEPPSAVLSPSPEPLSYFSGCLCWDWRLRPPGLGAHGQKATCPQSPPSRDITGGPASQL